MPNELQDTGPADPASRLKVITLSELTQVRGIIYHTDDDTPIINFQNRLNFIGQNIRFHIPDYIIPDERNFVDMDFADAFILYFYQRPIWTLVSSKPVAMLENDAFPDPKQIMRNCVYLNSGINFFNMRKSPRINHTSRYSEKSKGTFFDHELYAQEDFVPLEKIISETSFDHESRIRTNCKIYYKS